MRRLNPTVIALLCIVALIVVIWVFAGTRNADQDKLTGNVVTAQAADDSEALCSSASTYDLLKRALFQRAAQQRGGEQAPYDQVAQAASLRVEDPAMESQDKNTGAINCSGSVSIDLPPGVAADGGRTSLMADVDYAVQPAAGDNGASVALKNADALVGPLATLSRSDQAAQPGVTQQPTDEANATDETAADQAPGPVTSSAGDARSASPPASRPVAVRPSFDCDNASTAGEAAVCSDAGLAALDRSMAAQYGRAMAQADPDQRDLLEGTGERFLHYRDHCSTRACIGDAYTGRMREIRDIMAGTWRQSR